MPKTESLMLFYREAFPVTEFAGFVLIWQQCKSLDQWKMGVSAKYKTLVISYTLLPSTIAIITRRTLQLFSIRCTRFFFPPPRSPTRLLG